MRNREILFIIKLRNEARRTLRGFNSDLVRTTRFARQAAKAVDSVGTSTTTATRQVKAARGVFEGTGRTLGSLRRFALAAGLALSALGVGVGVTSLVQDFAAFDRGLIGVSKTTDIVGQDLADLGAGIQEISRTVPVGTDQLLQIAQAAGQLGVVGADNITLFTETVGKLGLASNLAGDEAATALARILTVSGEPIANVDRLGAAVVDLGNNFAATEREIGGAALRVARATAQFEIGAANAAGIGTALAAVGVKAEEGGTVIGRAFQTIDAAIRGGGAELENLRRITGLTVQELREGFADDPTAIFQSLIEGLGQVNRAGGSVAEELEGLGLEGVRVIGTLGTLATRSEVLGAALERSNIAFRENTALNEEAARAAQSFSAQLALTRNALSEAAVVFGDELAPLILEASQNFREFIIEAKEAGDIAAIAQNIGGAIKFVAENFDLLLIAAQLFIGLKIFAFFSRLQVSLAVATKGTTLFSAAMGKATLATRTLGRAIAGFLVFEALVQLIEFLQLVNTQVTETADGFDVVGEIIRVFSTRVSSTIGDLTRVFVLFGKAASAALRLDTEAAELAAAEAVVTINQILERDLFEGVADEAAQNIIDQERLRRAAVMAVDTFAEIAKAETAGNTDLQDAGENITAGIVQGLSEGAKLVQEEVQKINERIALIGLSNEQAEVQKQLNAILNAAKKEDINLTDTQISQLRERLTLEQQLTAEETQRQDRLDAQQKLNESFLQTLDSLRDQRELIGLTGDELEKARIIQTLRNQAAREGLVLSEAQLTATEAEVEKLQEARAELRGDAFAGARAGVQAFIDDAGDLNAQFETFSRSTLDGAADAFSEFVQTGKLELDDFVSDTLASLQKIATNVIFQQLLGGGGIGGGAGAGGGLGALVGSFFSKGGVVGRDGSPAVFAASAFKNAQRFQRGGTVGRRGTDSVPILATPGEVVLTENQADVLRNATEGRSVGRLSRASSSGGAVAGGRGGNMEVNVTVVVPGVSDAESFIRNKGRVATETAGALNRALQRDG